MFSNPESRGNQYKNLYTENKQTKQRVTQNNWAYLHSLAINSSEQRGPHKRLQQDSSSLLRFNAKTYPPYKRDWVIKSFVYHLQLILPSFFAARHQPYLRTSCDPRRSETIRYDQVTEPTVRYSQRIEQNKHCLGVGLGYFF